MNVLVISHYGIYDDFTASFVHNQVKALISLGCRVRVLIPQVLGKADRKGKKFFPLTETLSVDGAELYYFRHLSLSRFGRTGYNAQLAIAALAPLLPRVMRDFTPDIIHAHTLGYDSIIGAWLKKKLSCPLVVTTHGTDTLRPFALGQKSLLKLWCDETDAVVAVSSLLKEKLFSVSPIKSPTIILNGFSIHAHLTNAVPRDPYRMIQVGHLIPRKCFDTTIRALSLIRQKYPQATLTIIGEGNEQTHLLTLVDDLGLHDAVTFLGKLPNDRVLAEMTSSSFFVMPSKAEGFGIVYAEAMSAGCLTIGTEGEGIADLIVSGENGYLVPVDDPEAICGVICQSLENPAEAAAIAARGKEAALHLTWESNAEQYLSLYRKLLHS